MAKIGLQVKGFEEYMAKLDELGNGTAMKQGVESALKASKKYINPQIEKCMAKSNLPAGGKYSKGDTKKSINADMTVNWDGYTGSIDVGFDFKKSGTTSIFLMYGTPKMPPVPGLKAAIYGSKTQQAIAAVQESALLETIKRVMEG